MNAPWIYEDPVEIPGVGQIPGNVIRDAATQAEWELEQFGPAVAMRNIPALQEMIDKHYWRSEAAAEVMAVIKRQYALSMSKEGAGQALCLSETSPSQL